ncbi:MAG: hypothetical protein AAGJ12_02555 [Bacteroidota bacterium]|nr:hypothetical protein [uncultured Allomuricauda sp.]
MDSKTETKESLKSKIDKLKIVTGMLSAVLLILFVICVYGLLTKDDNDVFLGLIVVPIALSSILFVNVKSMKKMKSELESRR